jgi:hypothetical protein
MIKGFQIRKIALDDVYQRLIADDDAAQDEKMREIAMIA